MFGSEMISYLASEGHEATGHNRTNFNIDWSPDELASALKNFDVIINAIGYTLVDKAESESELAHKINAEFPRKLAQASGLVQARLVHISTDYIFRGGNPQPIPKWEESSPLNTYGRSKALGEKFVLESGADVVVFRAAWLYGAIGSSFPKSIGRSLIRGLPVRVVSDQIGQPTWTKDLAHIVLTHCLQNLGEPIVHAVASGETSWFEFALQIKESLGVFESDLVSPLKSSEYHSPAKRPAYSVLDNLDTKGPIIGDWRERWLEAAPEIVSSIKKSM